MASNDLPSAAQCEDRRQWALADAETMGQQMFNSAQASQPVAAGVDRALEVPAEPLRAPSSLREVMSQFATGVIVLTVGGEHIHGMTANAFGSVSIEPPLVQCSVAHSAVMHTALLSARRFAVSIMAADQRDLAKYFADGHRPLGPDQFSTLDWEPGPRTGAPLLSGALAWLECELAEAYQGGDHSIFLGAVLGGSRGPNRPALLFFDRDYHEMVPHMR
jgi:flavin reductase (DIM6/NTAB) family NADH-FMN oxidoreductase RutF